MRFNRFRYDVAKTLPWIIIALKLRERQRASIAMPLLILIGLCNDELISAGNRRLQSNILLSHPLSTEIRADALVSIGLHLDFWVLTPSELGEYFRYI